MAPSPPKFVPSDPHSTKDAHPMSRRLLRIRVKMRFEWLPQIHILPNPTESKIVQQTKTHTQCQEDYYASASIPKILNGEYASPKFVARGRSTPMRPGLLISSVIVTLRRQSDNWWMQRAYVVSANDVCKHEENEGTPGSKMHSISLHGPLLPM